MPRERGPALSRQRPGGPRPISADSPLQGRQLWRVGDWGGASEQIGRRWELFGAEQLRALLHKPRPGPGGAAYVPRSAVIISSDPALSAAVHRSGKAHADAILVGIADGHAIYEPVDFKWSLETAEPRQVGAEVLEALLARPPAPLAQRLAQALAEAGAPNPGAASYAAGFFLAPDSSPNRALLAEGGALPPDMVVLCAVEPLAFFSPLTGWEVALALAETDHARLDRLEAAERYYRLGAGVLGALRRLASTLFDEQPPELDGVAELVRLRAQRRLRTTGEVVAYLDRAQRARAELVERLRQVEGRIYPFSAFRRDLASRGLAEADARRLGRLHGEVLQPARRELRRLGRQLLSRGMTELQALAALEELAPRLVHLARRELERRLAQAIQPTELQAADHEP